MRLAMAIVGFCLPCIVFGEDSGLSTREQLREVRACLAATAEAANSEDLDAYISCFDPSLRPALKRVAGLRFAQHEVSVEVLDSHILECSPARCEVAVQYETTLSQQSFEVVSVLLLRRVEGSWKIHKETIRSAVVSALMDSPFPYGCSSCATGSTVSRPACSSGQCSLSGR